MSFKRTISCFSWVFPPTSNSVTHTSLIHSFPSTTLSLLIVRAKRNPHKHKRIALDERRSSSRELFPHRLRVSVVVDVSEKQLKKRASKKNKNLQIFFLRHQSNEEIWRWCRLVSLVAPNYHSHHISTFFIHFAALTILLSFLLFYFHTSSSFSIILYLFGSGSSYLKHRMCFIINYVDILETWASTFINCIFDLCMFIDQNILFISCTFYACLHAISDGVRTSNIDFISSSLTHFLLLFCFLFLFIFGFFPLFCTSFNWKCSWANRKLLGTTRTWWNERSSRGTGY